MINLILALKLTLKELKFSYRIIGIIVINTAFAVGAIGGLYSISQGIEDAIKINGSSILGGDIAFQRRFQDATKDDLQEMSSLGNVSKVVFVRTTLNSKKKGSQIFAEIKGVDNNYPLYGKINDLSNNNFQSRLTPKPKLCGIFTDYEILAQLDLHVGEFINIGDIKCEINGIIEKEPDKFSNSFIILPQIIMSSNSLIRSKLTRSGSLSKFSYRIKLNTNTRQEKIDIVKRNLKASKWNFKTNKNAAIWLQRASELLSQFLILLGGAISIIGGIGIANAYTTRLANRKNSLAIMKSLGANSYFFWTLSITETIFFNIIGSIIGIFIALTLSSFTSHLLFDLIGIEPTIFYPTKLFYAYLIGLFISIGFTLSPIANANQTNVTNLFRLTNTIKISPNKIIYSLILALTLATVGILILNSPQPRLTSFFIVFIIIFVIILRIMIFLLTKLLSTTTSSKIMSWKLALSNINSPNNSLLNVILSCSITLTLLITINIIQSNLTKILEGDIKHETPAFFVFGIQKNEAAELKKIVKEFNQSINIQLAPNMLGMVIKIKKIPISKYEIDQNTNWVTQGKRRFTFLKKLPSYSKIITGKWWGENYNGPPLVSLGHQIAKGLNVKVGDTITVNVLGRDLTATVANTRSIDWTNLKINFAMTFSPNTFKEAPYSLVGTISPPLNFSENQELDLAKKIYNKLPLVSSIRIKKLVQTIQEFSTNITNILRYLLVSLLASTTLILSSSLAANVQERMHNGAILKTLGTKRVTLLWSYIWEFGLLGLISCLISTIAGTVCSWLVINYSMNLKFTPAIMTSLLTAIIVICISIAIGLATTWKTLGSLPAKILRERPV